MKLVEENLVEKAEKKKALKNEKLQLIEAMECEKKRHNRQMKLMCWFVVAMVFGFVLLK